MGDRGVGGPKQLHLNTRLACDGMMPPRARSPYAGSGRDGGPVFAVDLLAGHVVDRADNGADWQTGGLGYGNVLSASISSVAPVCRDKLFQRSKGGGVLKPRRQNPRAEIVDNSQEHLVPLKGQSMVESKILIVLANSVRSKPNACVAGREVREGKNGARKYAGWIRPVSKSGSGEVTLAERSLTNGKEVSVLDIVQIQLAKHQNDDLQPENWILDGEKNWKLVGRATAKDLNELAESPAAIWMEKNEPHDRVSTQYIKEKAKGSLLLVKVPTVEIGRAHV